MVQEQAATQISATTRPLRERVGISIKNGLKARYTVQEVVESIQKAEAAGIQQIWMPQIGPLDTPTIFTAAALQTQQIRFNVGVVPTYTRHPLILAQQALAFDQVAPGRLRLGIGSSNKVLIEDVYGVPMGKKPLSQTREYMSVLRAAIETGQVEYQGEFFQVHYHEETTASIPLIISALGEKAFETAGEISDGALPWLAPIPYLLEKALPALKKGAQSQQRPAPPIIAGVLVALSEDQQAVQRAVLQQIEHYLGLPYYIRLFANAGIPLGPDGTGSEELISALVAQGSAAAVEQRLRQILATEIGELNLTLIPVVDEQKEYAQLLRIIGNL
ncbi:LLM class flavin-dependent oxidoreductase [Ktedonosporobacter rubrisoli]|nr:LLM class flavin-dependent oxidoreductase [Ktedonosporobacter rubrisoli]